MRGIRDLLWFEIRMGNLDGILTKPINTQFYVSISKPDLHQLPLLVVIVILFCNHLTQLPITLGFSQIALFSLMFVLGIAITYFVVSAYATAGFYVTKAAQVIEFFDKAADSAQYPMPIFPESIQLLAFSFVPIAYFSYVPTLFLLGRGNWQLVATATLVLVLSISINQWLWKRGLQHYSSASS